MWANRIVLYMPIISYLQLIAYYIFSLNISLIKLILL